MSRTRIGLLACLTFAVSAAVLYGAYVWASQGASSSDAPKHTQGEKITLQGNLVCLPKKGPGPHTMECAYGFMSKGMYYALDMSKVKANLFDYTFEDVLQVEGVIFDPSEDTSYAVEGEIQVDSIELVAAQS